MFRKEALQAHSPTLYGQILLQQTGAERWFTLAAATCLLSIGVFLTQCGFSRKEVVRGALLPKGGLIRVYAHQSGIVAEKRANEGQRVKQGDILFVLGAEQFGDTYGDSKALLTDSLRLRIRKLREERVGQQRQASQQQDTLARRRLAVEQQLATLAAEIDLQSQRVALVERAAERQADLMRRGFVSDAAVQDHRTGLLEQQSRLRALERNREALNADRLVLQAEALDVPVHAQREILSLDRSQAELEQRVAENEVSRRFVVRAPHAGRISALGPEPGQFVSPSSTMATILPENAPLEAELTVPSRAIGFIRPGGSVLIRYHAFPFQKFGQFKASIREVSRSALSTQELSDFLAKDPAEAEPFYRVRAALEVQEVTAFGNSMPLMPGMQLEASIILEYRKIHEWILEPLLGVAGRL